MSSASFVSGQWLGLLGGGQLGRMFCAAAQRMGFRVVVLEPEAASPAGSVADRQIEADYDDPAGLRALSDQADAFTTEFENVPSKSLRLLAAHGVVRPSAEAVAIAQDRIAEKRFISGCGIGVAPHMAIHVLADLDATPAQLFPAILKVSRLGYDGKGQQRVADVEEARAAFGAFGGVECVLEQRMPLAYEVSIVLARDAQGATASFPVTQNIHRDGILAVSIAPSPSIPEPVASQAQDWARRLAGALNYVGVLCVEFFVLGDGSLIVNEIAPRPHNSGHYTMDACVCSQFEQQVRVLSGLPLGSTQQHSPAIMLNLLGDLWYRGGGADALDPDWAAVCAIPGAALHLYGKREARAGRKMGHVTVTASSADVANTNALKVCEVLGIDVWEI